MVRFELADAFRTGLDAVDDDHHSLIERINAIAELEQRGDIPAILSALGEFRAELDDHFRDEEVYLAHVRYPALHAHATHHAKSISSLGRLVSALRDGQPIGESVANTCFHELIMNVLREDMRFVNWLADHPERRN